MKHEALTKGHQQTLDPNWPWGVGLGLVRLEPGFEVPTYQDVPNEVIGLALTSPPTLAVVSTP